MPSLIQKGEYIRSVRKRMGLTQKQFGELINRDTMSVSNLETGRTEVKPEIELFVFFLEFKQKYDQYIKSLEENTNEQS